MLLLFFMVVDGSILPNTNPLRKIISGSDGCPIHFLCNAKHSGILVNSDSNAMDVAPTPVSLLREHRRFSDFTEVKSIVF